MRREIARLDSNSEFHYRVFRCSRQGAQSFAAVDTRTVESLLTLMARWHEEGRTIIAVMHEFDQVRAHFPSTLLLMRSPIAWGDTSTVLTEDNLEKALSVA